MQDGGGGKQRGMVTGRKGDVVERYGTNMRHRKKGSENTRREE